MSINLAEAHVKALQHLQAGDPSFELGTGDSSSVKEVIVTVEEVTGRKVLRKIVPPRPGDPPTVADPTRAQQLLHGRLSARCGTASPQHGNGCSNRLNSGRLFTLPVREARASSGNTNRDRGRSRILPGPFLEVSKQSVLPGWNRHAHCTKFGLREH